MNSSLRAVLLLPLLLCLIACSREESQPGSPTVSGPSLTGPTLTGPTMGTTYNVIVPQLKDSDQLTLQSKIDTLLAQVNKEMSTYQPDSDISRFNASESTDWFSVPQGFFKVTDAAVKLAVTTEGAFDPTVGPLVKRWGFGKDKSTSPPDDGEISALLEKIGFDQLQLDSSGPSVKKSQATLQLDLNAIAKGHAVDLIADALDQSGYQDYLVEIGGELRVLGENANRDSWRIGIERPDVAINTKDKQAQSGLHLSSGGIATSGDYRNAFESDGVRYSHIIDPRSGWPVSHNLASVTVVAETAMMADAWATALMVLGPDDGMKIAEQQALACLFVVRDSSTGYRTQASSAYKLLEQN